MSEVKFPYQGWVLTPSFKPVETTFTGCKYGRDWHDADGKKAYFIANIFRSKGDAIANGREILVKQQTDLDKKQANIEKRRAALDKASA
ncbi:hypothetical protein [Delftia acidovorans]|uniref:Uncharacterized protein n=1 Tax=Delftia acidovorans TaxID=80866 RepID=A0AAJ2R8S4_DELAC|nr:hypothetical protein [Delftia acidovorans]MDX4957881.1 hypothetical protein [Delftia acidovorans]